jgi:hypothetical protein
MKRNRLLMSLCVANSVLGSAWTAFAADGAPVRSKVAVVDAIELPERMEATRARLNDLLGEAVRKRGFDLIRPAEGPSCADASCLPDFAKTSGATDVLIARGGRNGSYGYHVELRLWNAATGETAPAIADCSVCSGPQMTDSVAQAAGTLLDRVGVRTPPPVVPPPVPIAAVPASPVLVTPTNPPPSVTLAPSSGHQVLGWSFLAAGGVAAAAGGILWSFDGKGTDCVGSSCRSTYRTEREGIGLLAGGLVAAGVGAWLVLDSPNRDLAMKFGPLGAALAGVF